MRMLALGVVVLIVLGGSARADPINKVLGDRSWTAATPPDDAPQELRIRTHLEYVRALLGRATDLPVDRLALRTASLAALDAYIARGEFPRRTGDPYAGRRPRFIDDRGVHCAVGYLIAASGSPELARAIRARHEYAYVHDIDMPELHAWASEHGFTTDELAMIQPGYDAPPDEAGTRLLIAGATTDMTMTCASRHPPSASVKLRVTGDHRGRVIATADSANPFDHCFASAASQLHGRGAYMDATPKPFELVLTVAVPSLQPLFEKRVAALELDAGCTPRPGAVPTAAIFEVTGTGVRVTTSPDNTGVNRCFEAHVREQLQEWAGIASVRATRRVPIVSRLAPTRFRPIVETVANSVLAVCYPDSSLPKERITVRVAAVRDAAAFTITDDSGHAAFSTCVRDKLGTSLRNLVSVPIDSRDYFRIDTDVDITVPIAIDRAAVRSERDRRERRREARE